uniref:G-protein coupled receptors family 3 profile domain-containing protein n=1 Tax=Vannella robusta TaxID=1487602 RepID=A0A7S4IMH9_9EUKA
MMSVLSSLHVLRTRTPFRDVLTKILVLFAMISLCNCSPNNYTLHAVLVTAPNTGPPIFQSLLSCIQLALDDINNSTEILPNTELMVESYYHFGSAAGAIKRMLQYSEEGVSFVIGNYFVDNIKYTGSVGKVFDIAQLSASVSSPILSNDREYPYFSRLAPPATGQSKVIRETILNFASIQGPRGWDRCAIISTTDPYGVGLSEDFIEVMNEQDEIEIATYQQFIYLGEIDGTKADVQVELREIQDSKARIIVALIVGGYEDLIIDANEFGLVGDSFVWFVGDSISGNFLYNEEAIALSRGLLGTFQYIPEGHKERQYFDDLWLRSDPTIYYGAGETVSPYYYLTYDMVLTSAILIEELDKQGLLDSEEVIPGRVWTNELRKLSVNGTSGLIEFNSIGDRVQPASGSFYDPDTRTWKEYAFYDDVQGYNKIRDVIWHSGTNEIPDLDIREAFHYWSCHDGKKMFDPTGKSISLHTPDGSDIDDIDEDYHCDQFIDCKNLSDESNDCASSYTVLFIVFGCITGFMILVCILLIGLVIVYGLILKYRRLRVASPTFLLILLVSTIIGYSSVYAWFGKPHPVACGFQPWILGLSTISMIAALCAKNFRIWRIFRYQNVKQRISDLDLLVLWFAMILPSLVILVVWTIVSTPTATMEDRGGEEHYVCTTGGFTGKPGGLIFFFILVGYIAIVLMFGVILSILTRKVPTMFNESKLLAISIYNLVFFGCVIIPVVMVINPINPYAAWILRTVATLYGFTVTLVLQFAPLAYDCLLRTIAQPFSIQIQPFLVSAFATLSTRPFQVSR